MREAGKRLTKDPRDGPEPGALIELLETLKLTGVGDHARTATESLYEALIDAELTRRAA